jgi:putative two-component system response regulator
LTLSSEFRDEDTGAHIKRISFYTRELSLRMGLEKEFCDTIFYASPMHDVGKVAIPDSVLLKKGSLDDDEWKVMKTHTEIGARILEGSASPFLQMAVDIAHCHHERWDGRGYPRGLKEDEIPLTARIMNITDQYDALRSRRPYKPAFDQEKTVSIITRGDGRTMPDHFDPEVLAAFEKAADIFAEIFEEHQDD